jgi:hypothetical protein
MRRLRKEGVTYREIANHYGASIPAVRAICMKETYIDVN